MVKLEYRLGRHYKCFIKGWRSAVEREVKPVKYPEPNDPLSGLTIQLMFSFFMEVSLFVDLKIKHFKPTPSHFAPDSLSDFVQRYLASPALLARWTIFLTKA